ncbi:hypothetical protein LINPERHAP1_LOCUS33876 [Linum perenne]
MELTWEHTQ